jgi:hypothetical protein
LLACLQPPTKADVGPHPRRVKKKATIKISPLLSCWQP